MLYRSRNKCTDDKPSGREGVVSAILSAAVPLIAERGVRDVTFRDIAHAACVQHSLITRYFGSKTALIQRIAAHLGETLFRSATRSGDDFADIWERILREQRLPLRALVRILLDSEAKGEPSAAAAEKMEETIAWFREQLEITGSRLDVSLVIYLTMSFLMGTEVFGNHIQRILTLTDQELSDLRPRAVRVLLDSLTALRLAAN
jgi:AcrR family transcriptional regulator